MYVITYPCHAGVTTQPEPAGLRKDEELKAVELTVFIHGNEKPWNNKYNTI